MRPGREVRSETSERQQTENQRGFGALDRYEVQIYNVPTFIMHILHTYYVVHTNFQPLLLEDSVPFFNYAVRFLAITHLRLRSLAWMWLQDWTHR